jgi:hypothetical protein
MQRFSCTITVLLAALLATAGLHGEDNPAATASEKAAAFSAAAPSAAAPSAAPDKAAPDKAAVALPAEVDLRPELLKYGLGPRRQGRRNTCSVFTTAATIEFALSKAEGKGEKLSVEYLNWACNQIIGNKTQDRGQFFRDLLKGYDRYGICTEAEMPYRRRFDSELSPSEEASKQAKGLRARDFQIHWIVRWKMKSGLTDQQMHEIHRVLASGYPVAAGAAHSRLLVGYRDDAKPPGGGEFLTKDSGSGSFGGVSYEFVRTEVNDVFWVELPARDSNPAQ